MHRTGKVTESDCINFYSGRSSKHHTKGGGGEQCKIVFLNLPLKLITTGMYIKYNNYKFKANLLLLMTKLITFLNFDKLDNWVGNEGGVKVQRWIHWHMACHA